MPGDQRQTVPSLRAARTGSQEGRRGEKEQRRRVGAGDHGQPHDQPAGDPQPARAGAQGLEREQAAAHEQREEHDVRGRPRRLVQKIEGSQERQAGAPCRRGAAQAQKQQPAADQSRQTEHERHREARRQPVAQQRVGAGDQDRIERGMKRALQRLAGEQALGVGHEEENVVGLMVADIRSAEPDPEHERGIEQRREGQRQVAPRQDRIEGAAQIAMVGRRRRRSDRGLRVHHRQEPGRSRSRAPPALTSPRRLTEAQSAARHARHSTPGRQDRASAEARSRKVTGSRRGRRRSAGAGCRAACGP